MKKHTTHERIPQLCACGCGNPVNVNTGRSKQPKYLPYHYQKSIIVPLKQRLWSRVLILGTDECWEWQGFKDKHGYGTISSGGKYGPHVLVHRVAFELHCGPIPNELGVLHKCDNPPCCNPNHLFLGTDADNVADKMAKDRQPRGEKIANSKLTEVQVKEILRRYRQGENSPLKLSVEYGVSASAIQAIVYRKTWKHIL